MRIAPLSGPSILWGTAALAALGIGLLMTAPDAPREIVKLAPRTAAPETPAAPVAAVQAAATTPAPTPQVAVAPRPLHLVPDDRAGLPAPAAPAREIHAVERKPLLAAADPSGAAPEPPEDSN